MRVWGAYVKVAVNAIFACEIERAFVNNEALSRDLSVRLFGASLVDLLAWAGTGSHLYRRGLDLKIHYCRHSTEKCQLSAPPHRPARR